MTMMSAQVKASMPGMLKCRHANFWHAWAHILAQQGQIREIKVSMVRGDMPVMSIISVHMHATMHVCYQACTVFFLSHAWAQIPDKWDLIGEIKVSME